MSVQNGQPVNAQITNAALMSRLNDTSTIGRVDVNNATDSTLPTNGAIHTQGGLGVEKSVNVGENANIAGTLDVTGVASFDEVQANNINATADITAGNNITATGIVTGVSGNFTTTVDVGTDLTVNNDAIITGNVGSATSSTTGLATANSLEVTTSATVGTTLEVTGNTTLSTVSTTGLASLQSAQTTAGLTVGTDLQVNGDATVTGNLTVNGTLTSVNSATLEVTDQNILVNNNGNDATSEGAGLTVERTGTSGSLIYKDASATKWAAGALGSEVDVVGTSSTQTLTNKTIDGNLNTITNVTATSFSGTLPIANGGTGETTAVAAFDALAPSTTKGDLIVHNGTDNVRLPVGTNNQVLVADSAEAAGVKWTTANFGGGGGVNLIENGDYESGIQIWTSYNDSSTTRPVDGIGGTPTIPAPGFIITNTIRGNGSFALSKDAANRQGQGWAISNIQIPQEFRGKPLRTYMAFKFLTNGDFTAGSNGSSPTDGDAIVYFYDQTNNKLVEPSNIKFFSNGTLVDSYESTIQFDVTCSQVRLIVHIASTSTTAWQMILDSISLGPELVTQGATITRWRPYTPTLTHASGAATNYNVTANWRQNGDSIDINGVIAFTGTSAAFTGVFISLPPGHQIDINKITGIGLGTTVILDAGIAAYQGAVTYNNTTTVTLQVGGAAGSYVNTSVITNTIPFTFGNTDGINFEIKGLPIVGLEATSKISEPGDTRPFYVSAGLSSPVSVPSGVWTKLPFATRYFDSHGSWDSVNQRYRVFAAGPIKIRGIANWDFTASIVNFEARLYINGVGTSKIQSTGKSGTGGVSTAHNFEFSHDAKAGDTIEIYVQQGSGANITVRSELTANQLSYLVIESFVQGSQAIAAGEKIRARYRCTTGPAVNTGAPIITFNGKDYDTHGLYNSGEFRPRRADFYDFKASIQTISHTTTPNFLTGLFIYVNGALRTYVCHAVAETSNSVRRAAQGSTGLYLLSTDVVTFRGYSDQATNLSTDENANWIEISAG